MVSGGRSGLPPAPFPLEFCVAGRYSSPTFSVPDIVLPSGLPISFSRAPVTTLGRLVRKHVHEPFCPSMTFVGAAPALLWLGLCRTPARVPGAVAGRIPRWSPPACPEADRTQHPLVVSAPSRILSGRTVDGTLWFWSWLCQIADTTLLSHQPRSYGLGLSAASLVLRNDRKCRSPAPWPPCPPRHQAVGRPQATLKSNSTPPRCSDCRVEFLLVAPPSPSPLAGRAGQLGGSASGPAAFWSVPPGRRRSGTPDTSPLLKPLAYPPQSFRHSQVTARRMVVDGSQDFCDHLFFFSIRCFPRTTQDSVPQRQPVPLRPKASEHVTPCRWFLGPVPLLQPLPNFSELRVSILPLLDLPGRSQCHGRNLRVCGWIHGSALLSDSTGQGVIVPVLLSSPVDNFEFVLCQPLQPVGYLPFRFPEVPEPPQCVVVCAGCELSAVQVRLKVARSPNEG
ncbi:hypothetical protein T03_11393 [Trichinella britovi]|uniref:Uncharacterized protein n=1 Tax=Trichinella britovi TaxID=45882 RepID=A0A0V1C6T4_TRIBR|nr:hypothetical protein T03_11393 [Trichinella britovi]